MLGRQRVLGGRRTSSMASAPPPMLNCEPGLWLRTTGASSKSAPLSSHSASRCDISIVSCVGRILLCACIERSGGPTSDGTARSHGPQMMSESHYRAMGRSANEGGRIYLCFSYNRTQSCSAENSAWLLLIPSLGETRFYVESLTMVRRESEHSRSRRPIPPDTNKGASWTGAKGTKDLSDDCCETDRAEGSLLSLHIGIVGLGESEHTHAHTHTHTYAHAQRKIKYAPAFTKPSINKTDQSFSQRSSFSSCPCPEAKTSSAQALFWFSVSRLSLCSLELLTFAPISQSHSGVASAAVVSHRSQSSGVQETQGGRLLIGIPDSSHFSAILALLRMGPVSLV